MGPRPIGRGNTTLQNQFMAGSGSASMGPRPIGRGNTRVTPELHTRRRLQWGRDRSVAEIRRSRVAGTRRRPPASMGPRPIGRGNSAQPCRRNTAPPAGFNGAATDRSRKFRNAVIDLGYRQGASMGPRPIGRGNTRRRNASTWRQRCASMGPRPIGRGNGGDLAGTYPNPSVLQWGRDRSVAEIPRHSLEGHRSVGFNGAATDRSRKLNCCLPVSVEGGAASMGPRPIGRGNSPERSRSRTTGGALQWGRDRSVAEMRGNGERLRRRGRLQWGRDRSVAEILADPGSLARGRRGFNGAATDRSRKSELVLMQQIEAVGLQWGRDRSVAEIAFCFLSSSWSVSSFNGAATDRSRKFQGLRPRRGPQCTRFNGAATDRSRK